MPKMKRDYPTSVDELSGLGGNYYTADFQPGFLESLPPDVTFIVAGSEEKGYRPGPDDIEDHCRKCNGVIWLHVKDLKHIAQMKNPYPLCPRCYFSMVEGGRP